MRQTFNGELTGKLAVAMRKICVLCLAMTCIIAWSVTSFAANKTADQGEAGTSTFAGYKITVLDQTTLAASVRGRTNDRNVMCFVAANGDEVGAISYADFNAIIQKHQRVVPLSGGGTYGAPPVDGKSWEDWFADEFNSYRSLAPGSREQAVAANIAEKTENYRLELVRLVNEEREKVGLPPYIIDDQCMEYSQIRVQELVTLFEHTRPDGTNAGYEIISAKGSAPADAIQAWMESPGHKAAILNETRKYVGAGVHITSTGGYYWQMYFERDPEVYANTKIMGS